MGLSFQLVVICIEYIGIHHFKVLRTMSAYKHTSEEGIG